ncbi:MAG: hypothetical protein ACFHWX_21125 [Bacteroidota bacterium]
MSSESTSDALISKLKKLYGGFDFDTKKFVEASNSIIARELGYSDAQFSRLINGHATEGEYQRAIQNADRILALKDYKEKFAKVKVDPKKALASPWKRLFFFIMGLIIGGFGFYIISFLNNDLPLEYSRYDLLKWSFESNFINPYIGLRDLPADCDYECYKYQGRWELKDEYKLPFLRESSGFHYLAKYVVAYIQCKPNQNSKGKLMKGYEYQEHEIWYDILERPISTFIQSNGIPNDFYSQIKFDHDGDFVKIGTIHSFYTNDFKIDSLGIFRQGQDIGRDIEFTPESELASQLNNKSLLEKIKREVTLIIQDPLHDFSQPSSCYPADKPTEDFHTITNGDVMTFDCRMTTAGRFPIRYIKSYILKDQFVKDRCVSAVE